MDTNLVQRNTRFLRLPDVERCTGLKKSHLYEAIKAGTFPRPVKMHRTSLWVESEIFDWVRARIAERDGAGPAPRLLVTEKELSAALDISLPTLRKDRTTGKTIPFIKIGGSVRYDVDDVRAALKASSTARTKVPS